MLTFKKVGDKPTVLQQLTGLSPAGFGDLLPMFVQATDFYEQQTEAQRSTRV